MKALFRRYRVMIVLLGIVVFDISTGHFSIVTFITCAFIFVVLVYVTTLTLLNRRATTEKENRP